MCSLCDQGQFLLDNLLDPKKEYGFAIEMDAPVERKKRFVAIRTQARETNTPEESGYVSGLLVISRGSRNGRLEQSMK